MNHQIASQRSPNSCSRRGTSGNAFTSSFKGTSGMKASNAVIVEGHAASALGTAHG